MLLVLASAGVFVGLALSYSQSSLLALDVGLVVLAGVVWRGRAVLGFGALAVLVLLASLAVPTTRHKIFHTSLSDITSNRSSILSKGIDAFQRHPLPARGSAASRRSAGTTPEERARIAPHNVVLQEAVELGVLGLIVLAGDRVRGAAPAAAPGGRVARARAAPGARRELAAIGVSSLFYASLFEDPIFWVAAALSRSGAVPSAPGERTSPHPPAGRSGTRSGRPARSRRAGTRRRAAASGAVQCSRSRASRTQSTTVSGSQIRSASQTNG